MILCILEEIIMSSVFSSQLQSLRKARGVTQEQLAQSLSVSAQAVSKWENGSYPDGDLLPKIADYFGVTIDYLYGRERDEQSIEQQIVSMLNAVSNSSEWPEKAHNILWATQISIWKEGKRFYARPVSSPENLTASTLLSDDVITYMRLNSDFEYYTFLKKPENGYEGYFKDFDGYERLFSFLADKSNLKILCYMLSLNRGEQISAQAVSRQLSVPLKKTEEALDFLCNITKQNPPVNYFYIIKDDGSREKIYGGNTISGISFIILLAAADTMLNSPDSYQMQVCATDKGLFDRSALDFAKAYKNDKGKNNP